MLLVTEASCWISGSFEELTQEIIEFTGRRTHGPNHLKARVEGGVK